MNQLTEPELIAACRALFGSEVEVSHDFLRYLQPSGAKAAYRVMAKKTHPDLQPHAQPEQRGETFRRVSEAYQLLSRYLLQRETGRPSPLPPRTEPVHEAGSYLYQGELPQRHLELGRYLFYRGLIPYRMLIEAITWQRRQRPNIGSIARRWNWLSEAAIRTVLQTGLGRFGEKAVHLGLLNRSQVQQLLLYQRSVQSKFGQFFLERGLFTRYELERLVREQKEHNRKVAARVPR